MKPRKASSIYGLQWPCMRRPDQLPCSRLVAGYFEVAEASSLERVTTSPAYWKHTPRFRATLSFPQKKKKKRFDKSLLQSPTLRELSQAVPSLPPGDGTALALALYLSVAQAVCQLPEDLPVLQFTGGGGAGQTLPVNKERPECSQENPGGVQGRRCHPSTIGSAG